MAILNRSFEIPGATAGEAASWTEIYDIAAELVALFDSQPFEDFENAWNNTPSRLAFIEGDLDRAMFESGGNPMEGFEYSWSQNHQSILAFGSVNLDRALFDAGANDEEDFEATDWGNAGVLAFIPAYLDAAKFDAANDLFEDFEEEWNQSSYFFPAVLVYALFDAGANNYEDFEGVWTSVLVW